MSAAVQWWVLAAEPTALVVVTLALLWGLRKPRGHNVSPSAVEHPKWPLRAVPTGERPRSHTADQPR